MRLDLSVWLMHPTSTRAGGAAVPAVRARLHGRQVHPGQPRVAHQPGRAGVLRPLVRPSVPRCLLGAPYLDISQSCSRCGRLHQAMTSRSAPVAPWWHLLTDMHLPVWFPPVRGSFLIPGRGKLHSHCAGGRDGDAAHDAQHGTRLPQEAPRLALRGSRGAAVLVRGELHAQHRIPWRSNCR